jgi:hypothetical protein
MLSERSNNQLLSTPQPSPSKEGKSLLEKRNERFSFERCLVKVLEKGRLADFEE